MTERRPRIYWWNFRELPSLFDIKAILSFFSHFAVSKYFISICLRHLDLLCSLFKMSSLIHFWCQSNARLMEKVLVFLCYLELKLVVPWMLDLTPLDLLMFCVSYFFSLIWCFITYIKNSPFSFKVYWLSGFFFKKYVWRFLFKILKHWKTIWACVYIWGQACEVGSLVLPLFSLWDSNLGSSASHGALYLEAMWLVLETFSFCFWMLV